MVSPQKSFEFEKPAGEDPGRKEIDHTLQFTALMILNQSAFTELLLSKRGLTMLFSLEPKR